ncbi:MAG: hypothetical protein JXR48_01875 [Candidatus Delongbacteria bacterium]|nr:hypothetical protein [Candidatus Delongbacteria bacterium]
MYKIEFPEKFSAKDFSQIIPRKYAQSLHSDKILFDLEKTEWISLEGITFLFGWINKIKSENENVEVKVVLPNPSVISSDYDEGVLNKNKSKRRERRLINLIEVWLFRLFCDIKPQDIVNPPPSLNKLIEERRKKNQNFDGNWQRIIPFRKIDANIYNELQNIRSNLDDELTEIFSFEEDVNELLNRFSAYTPFKNKTLSHLVTVELLLNTLHHSGIPKDKSNECFFSISLIKKFNKEDIKDEIQRKKIDEYIKLNNCSYYEAKEQITEISEQEVLAEYNKRLKYRLPRNIESERLDYTLSFFKQKESDQYSNYSYVEFTFLDFGKGIPNTLKEDYILNKNKSKVTKRFSKKHSEANLDGKILEYAFLLDSSRNSFSKNLGIQDFVPRGLYFLLDIVRLYNGLLVVKSGKGEVVYDFSKTQDILSAISFKNNDYNFPGTLINILIPEQRRNEIKLQPIQEIKTISSSKAKRKYISIIDIYRSFQEQLETETHFNSIDLYNFFFIEINNLLDEVRELNCNTILYLDFAGATLSYLDYKIFYFLSNTPKINKHTNIVLLNLTNKSLLEEVRNSLVSFEPFIFRPIPCVIEEANGINITWIGIKNIEDEKRLNALLKFEDYTLPTSDFDSPESLSGNVIEVNWLAGEEKYGNIQRSTYLPSINDIEYVNNELLNKKLRNRILNPTINDEDILLQSKDSVFLTSGGYYQYEFVKFIDLLFNKDSNNRAFSERIAINLINKWRCKCGSIPSNLDWIITVTLSSQMLGRDVKKVYQRLLELNDKKKQPKLLKLAHYYEFSNETGFENIKAGQNVLVVNDVISTGSLNSNLYESLKAKKANVVAFFSIVDCRKTDEQIDEAIEKKSIFIKELDNITITLVDNLAIDKYLHNIKGVKDIIKINPIINAPTTMELQHSEQFKIIYPDIENVLTKIKPQHLLVGYFKNNKSHHTYFPNTENIFLEYEGKEFLRDLIHKVLLIEKEKNKKENKNGKIALVDYVFYPVFSGIESFEDYHFQQYFGNPKLHSYPIPRIDTVKGWRFTFPPKILNKITENKTVFILDDGSCSGETILQMIDSICFLDVKKIIVLSVFGRLEDFQREFFSRIKKMKVKNLKNGSNDNEEPIIDTHIYFGTHLNIHHYPYEKSTPFITEYEELNNIKNKNSKTPDLVKLYIHKRLKDLKIIEVNDYEIDNYTLPSHFPLLKETNELEVRKIYEVRNILGRLDSYRIYKDYYKNTEFKKSEDLELIIGIVNHEPQILDTIKHLLPEVFKRLNQFINDIVFYQKPDFQLLTYKWSFESLLRFLFTIDYSVLYNDKKLLAIFTIIDSNHSKESYSYLMYLLWKEIIEDSKYSTLIENTILRIWHTLYQQKEFEKGYYRIITNLIDAFQYKEVSSIEKAFYNLYMFYTKETANKRHKQLEQNISSTIPSLIDFEVQKIDTPDLEKTIRNIKSLLKKNLDKLNENNFIKDNLDSIYNLLYNSDNSLYQSIVQISSLSEEVIKLDIDVNKERSNKNEQQLEIFKAKRKELAEKLMDFESEFVDVNSTVAKLCLNYFTNPVNSWERIVSSHKKVEGYDLVNFNIKSINKEIEIKFPIHREALEKVFSNVLHNICQKAIEEKVKLTYKVDCKGDVLLFCIEQDKHFNIEENKIAGKGLQQIREIVKECGGNVVMPPPNSGHNMYYHFVFTLKK